jgi:hypothetical protein
MKRLRVLLVCVVLEAGVLAGSPMRPDEIQELLHQLNQPTLAHVLPSETDEGDGPPRSGRALGDQLVRSQSNNTNIE